MGRDRTYIIFFITTNAQKNVLNVDKILHRKC